MNKKGNYEDCLKFIENQLGIHLFNFQKEYIKAYFEDRLIIGNRCAGKTICKKAVGKYIDSLIIDEFNADGAYVNE